MKWLASSIFWGSLLILGGVLYLLETLGVIDIGGYYGAIIIGLGGAFFLSIFITNRANWWALIPAGTLLSLAIAVGFGNYLNGAGVGGIFLVGLGLTFAVIALIPTPKGRMWWAWIPAAILGVIGLIASATTIDIIKFIWPAVLILGGLMLLFYSLRLRGK
jgi:hypothetical protein